jgi:hypothetical protein
MLSAFTGSANQPNVKAKAARATDEPANQHNARGARSLFGRRLGIVWPFSVLELNKLPPVFGVQ